MSSASVLSLMVRQNSRSASALGAVDWAWRGAVVLGESNARGLDAMVEAAGAGAMIVSSSGSTTDLTSNARRRACANSLARE